MGEVNGGADGEVAVVIAMPRDLAERGRRVAVERGHDEAEGLILVFGRGVVALEQDGAPEAEGATIDARLARLRTSVLDLESSHAALRFRAFHLQRDNQALSMNVTGLRAENDTLRAVVERTKAEADKLRALLRVVSTPRAQATPEPAPRASTTTDPIGALVDWLRIPDIAPRTIPEIVKRGPATIPALEALLRGPSERIWQPRALAADVLGAIGGDAAVEALVRALADTSSRVLAPTLLDAERVVIDRIAEALGTLGDPRVATVLLAAFRVRPHVGCARALARLGDARAIPLLVESLRDDRARARAAEALRSFGPAAVPDLLRTWSQPSPEYDVEAPTRVAARAAMIALLGELGADEVDDAIAGALNDPSGEIREASAVAVARRGGGLVAAAVAILVDAISAADRVGAAQATDALVMLGPDAIDRLVPLMIGDPLDEPALRRRVRAIEILGRLGAVAATERLVEQLASSDPRVRQAAVMALGAVAIDRPAAIDSIVRALVDPHPAVRTAARTSIASLGTAARPALEVALAGPRGATVGRFAHWRLRRAARRALARLTAGGARTTPSS